VATIAARRITAIVMVMVTAKDMARRTGMVHRIGSRRPA